MTLYEPETPAGPVDGAPEIPLGSGQATTVLRRRRSSSRVRTIIGSLLAAGLISAGLWAYFNPQVIDDQFTVWQFEPSAPVAEHVERLGLTDHGTFLYYASTPVVRGHDAFAAECPAQADEEMYGILGCYLPGDMTIFLFDVTDDRLDGTEEVTAAHEMLHAAWDRLGDDERQRLSALLEVEFDRLSTDTAFVERMEFYARTEPGERANELHSIIGTEFYGLSPELETYYAQYFTDRSIVTSLHEVSNALFVELRERSDAIVAELEALQTGIESDYASYTAGYDTLNNDIDDFNTRADNGSFRSQSQFNRERDALIARQDALDALFVTISTRETHYNVLVAELDEINLTATELGRGLNIGGEVASDLAGSGTP